MVVKCENVNCTLFVSERYLTDEEGLFFSCFFISTRGCRIWINSFITCDLCLEAMLEVVQLIDKRKCLGCHQWDGQGNTSVGSSSFWNRSWRSVVNLRVSFSFLQAFIHFYIDGFFSQVLELLSVLSEESHICLQFYLSYLGWLSPFVFHSSFSQLNHFLTSFSQGYTAVLYHLALNHRQLYLVIITSKNEYKKSTLLFWFYWKTSGLGWTWKGVLSFFLS